MPIYLNVKICDFTCSKKSDWTTHLTTTKHKLMDEQMTNNALIKNATNYECICGKIYKHRHHHYGITKKSAP